MKTYTVVFFGTALIAIFAMPLVTRLARRFGLVDPVGPRKVHATPVPRVGGVVFVVATLMLVIPVFFLDNTIGAAFGRVWPRIVALLVCGTFIYAVGLVDDICSLRASVKLLSLLGAGMVICLTGARIKCLSVAGLFMADLGWLSWPVTLLWIAGVAVALNFIDGLDGLAGGIGAIVCGTICLFAFHTGHLVMGVLMLALLGSLVGFLFFNWYPAKVFMGDGGAMYLGFMIGAGSVVCQAKTATLAGIAVPALALGVPLFDAVLTMIRRKILDRRSILTAERGHIHHRLLDKGYRHQTVVLLMYGVTALAAGVGGLMLTVRHGNQLVVLGGGLFLLVVVFRLAGASRLKETIAAIRRNWTIARQLAEEKSIFEDAQIRVRRATTFAAWWKGVCAMAEKMEMDRLILFRGEGGNWSRAKVWQRSREPLSPADVLDIVVPLHTNGSKDITRLEMAVRRNGSVEPFGRRAALLCRLLDDSSSSVALRPAEPRQQPAIVPARETLETLGREVLT